jgi:hypothetical protein
MTKEQKIIRAKVGLLESAKQLGNQPRLQNDGLFGTAFTVSRSFTTPAANWRSRS